jgi:predicted AAA+ superfamily ATPase
MIDRKLGRFLAQSKKSILLLGPRQTGKSTLIQSLKPAITLNLAREHTFLELASDPSLFEKEVGSAKTIFVDEIQRLPSLLNTIQALCDEDKARRFFLTGSSARKLKRGKANLLPGRLLTYELGPLACSELDYKMDTAKALSLGTLPEPYLTHSEGDAKKLLRSYSQTYLKEEIQAEALTRSLESFLRFFNETILCVGQFIDYTKLAKKAKISRHSCARYFEVLQDTLIGGLVFPHPELAQTLDLIRHPKFYLFDCGVYNGLLQNFSPSLDRMGVLSELLIYSQLQASAKAADKPLSIHSLRTRAGLEIDFVVTLEDRTFFIEVKSSDDVRASDLGAFETLAKQFPKQSKLFVLHMGKKEKTFGKVHSLPWQKGFQEMGL